MRRLQAVLEATGGGEVLFERDARDLVLCLSVRARASARRLSDSPPSPLLLTVQAPLTIAESKVQCLHVTVRVRWALWRNSGVCLPHWPGVGRHCESPSSVPVKARRDCWQRRWKRRRWWWQQQQQQQQQQVAALVALCC